MRRQAAIVLALSTGANYLLFDETFDGLDPVVRKFVKKKMCEIVADKNATVIITSHSLRELEDICDHLVLLHKGNLVVDSDIIELKTHKFKVQIAFKEEFDREKSVYIISGYMKLTREEAFAIRYHMGYSSTEDARNVAAAFEMFPLAFALSTADSEATYFVESKNKMI